MTLQDEILVECPAENLYELIQDVPAHSSLLPGYRESTVISRSGNHGVVRRQAVIHGKLRGWTSEVRWEPGRALHFVQREGPLKGMHVEWLIIPCANGSVLKITHEVNVTSWWKKWWMERWVARPAIEKTARIVLEAIKTTAESSWSQK